MSNEDLIKRIDELFVLVQNKNPIESLDRVNNSLLDIYILRLRYSGNIDAWCNYQNRLNEIRRER